jgi:hypothetical protein
MFTLPKKYLTRMEEQPKMEKQHSWESESLQTRQSGDIEIPKIPEKIEIEIKQPEIKISKKVDQFGFYKDTVYKHLRTNVDAIRKQERDWIDITNDWQNALARKQYLLF